jgi:hypothetical protein
MLLNANFGMSKFHPLLKPVCSNLPKVSPASPLQNPKKSTLNLDKMCREGNRQPPVDIVTKQVIPAPNLTCSSAPTPLPPPLPSPLLLRDEG